MSARRKHVRAHARDVEVEVDGENDLVCRVEEIKGGNVTVLESAITLGNDLFDGLIIKARGLILLLLLLLLLLKRAEPRR